MSIKVAKYAGDDVDELMENYEYGFCSLIKATNRVLENLKLKIKYMQKLHILKEKKIQCMIITL